jgi:hypothetical protein
MKKQGWQRGDARQFAQAHLRGGSTTAPARRKGCLGNAVWMAFVYLAIDSDAPQCLRRWWGPPFFTIRRPFLAQQEVAAFYSTLAKSWHRAPHGENKLIRPLSLISRHRRLGKCRSGFR